MTVIKFCKNTCCPTLTFDENDETAPLVIKDDFEGYISLSLHDFFMLTTRIKKMVEFIAVQPAESIQLGGHTLISNESPYEIAIANSKIKLAIAQDLTPLQSVQEITVEEWLYFESKVKEQYQIS